MVEGKRKGEKREGNTEEKYVGREKGARKGHNKIRLRQTMTKPKPAEKRNEKNGNRLAKI